MRTCLFILLSVLFVVGCEKEKADLFTDTRYIKFRFYNDLGEDYYKLNYSFAYEPDDVQEKELKIPVEYRGYTLTEGLAYAVAVDTGTTLPQRGFNLTVNQIFQADSSSIDSLTVVLFRDESLKQESKKLRIKLISNENFQTYMSDSLFVEITVDDIFTKPSWWDLAILGNIRRLNIRSLLTRPVLLTSESWMLPRRGIMPCCSSGLWNGNLGWMKMENRCQ